MGKGQVIHSPWWRFELCSGYNGEELEDLSRRVTFLRKSDKGGQEAVAVSKGEVMA